MRARNLDGSLFSAFGFFALRGLAASYDVDFTPYLNEKGVAAMASVEQDCVFDLFRNAFVRSETLTRNGLPVSALITDEPFASIIAAQRIGTIKPSVPVLVTHSALDDTIPYAVGRAMPAPGLSGAPTCGCRPTSPRSTSVAWSRTPWRRCPSGRPVSPAGLS